MKVEVHHIEPTSEGGTDSFDNAIALCFDCHCDAGHYNPEHPRGSKFSPNELRRARDEWYSRVEQHDIEPPRQDDLFYCRYLIAKEYDIIREVVTGDLTNFPAEQPLLGKTPAFESFTHLAALYGSSSRPTALPAETYKTEEELLRANPSFQRTQPHDPHLPFYAWHRPVEASEVEKEVSTRDPLIDLLVENGAEPTDLCATVARREHCGRRRLQASYLTRPVWGVFLEVRNTANEPIFLEAIEAQIDRRQLAAYRQYSHRADVTSKIEAPKSPLPPDASAVFPLGLVMAPYYHTPFHLRFEEREGIATGETQTLSHGTIDEPSDNFRLIGSFIDTEGVYVRHQGATRYRPIHRLTLSNLYMLDRAWEVGSCPHVFSLSEGTVNYIDELFHSAAPGEAITSSIFLRKPSERLYITELEPEISAIESLEIQGQRLSVDWILTRGETKDLGPVPPGQIDFTGWYWPLKRSRGPPVEARLKNRLIGQYLHMANKRLSNSNYHT